MLKADGFDAAVIGVGYRCGQPPLIIYDAEKCVNILMTEQGMSFDEAQEYFSFNVEGGWHGEHTPIWFYKQSLRDIEELH